MRLIGAIAGVLASAAGVFIIHADRRAAYWRPVFESIFAESGNGPVKSVSVMPLKGCGWSLGETVYGEFTIGGVPADFEMCRSRHGVRFDITTYESRWIERGAQ